MDPINHGYVKPFNSLSCSLVFVSEVATVPIICAIMSVIPVSITAHLEQTGDTTVCAPQQFVGTKGQSRRLEGFAIHGPNIPGIATNTSNLILLI